MVISRIVKCRILCRSCALQLFLNYKTMQGAGYANALLPLLKKSSSRESDTAKAASFINGHPVFSSIALGAIAKRLHDEPQLSHDEMAEWKRELSTPLGAIGDTLIWEKFKPLLVVIAATLLLSMRNATATTWMVVLLSIWGLYNLSLHFFRSWGFDRGSELGSRVMELALHPGLTAARRALRALALVAAAGLVSVSIVSMDFAVSNLIAFGAGFLIIIVSRKLRLGAFTAIFLALAAGLLLHYLALTT
ncbi:PTS system mannose/fructose/sorbose family transporter subunit IID [bacterium]|nr:PTS system mannose/fructose/sorbose family transporter subunit IID [bacterium]